MSMQKLLDHENTRKAVSTMCFGNAGLAEGTNANTIQIAAAVDYSIDGIMYTKAITDNIAMTALAAQADLTTCRYLVAINAAGAVLMVKGTEVLTANIGTYVDGEVVAATLPDVPEGYCPLGAITIVLSGGTFTSGTTDLAGTGVTDTYQNFSIMPDA